MSTPKISLPIGIFATINVMFGTGVLINTTNLMNLAGFYGFLAYVIVGVLLIPLLYVFAKLLKKYPQGGFYTFSTFTLGQHAAFISTWAYFTGKLASATLLIHVFSKFFLSTFALTIPILWLDLLVLALFIWINFYGMKTGVWLTLTFMTLKLIPTLTIIFTSLFLYQSWHISSQPIPFSALISALPLVLYAFVGFEAACSLSSALHNPEKNASRMLIIAFTATVALTITYQFMVFLGLSSYPHTLHNYIDAFAALFSQLPLSSKTQQLITSIIYVCSGFAALGGSYAVLLSNTWNLYTLAQNNHIPYAHIFIQQNNYGMPFACVLMQGIICLFYFVTTQAQQIVLQQISVLGCSIAFLISCLSYTKITLSHKDIKFILSLLALLSAMVLLINCFISLYNYQLLSYMIFYGLLLLVGMAFGTRK